MLGYDFQIIHIKGNKSVVVDALPRKHEDVDALPCVISTIHLDVKELIFGLCKQFSLFVYVFWGRYEFHFMFFLVVCTLAI